MSEFKYACPVCGQHISCDVSQAGTEMTCPTCFQKIIAPQPMSNDSKLILTGTKSGDPTARNPGTRFQPPPATKKGFPGSLVVGLILIFICTVVAFIYHGTIFKTPAPVGPTNQVSSATNPASSNDTNETSKPAAPK